MARPNDMIYSVQHGHFVARELSTSAQQVYGGAARTVYSETAFRERYYVMRPRTAWRGGVVSLMLAVVCFISAAFWTGGGSGGSDKAFRSGLRAAAEQGRLRTLRCVPGNRSQVDVQFYREESVRTLEACEFACRAARQETPSRECNFVSYSRTARLCDQVAVCHQQEADAAMLTQGPSDWIVQIVPANAIRRR